MKIVVIGGTENLFPGAEAEIIYLTNTESLQAYADADAVINLHEDSGREDYSMISGPVFINNMNDTLKELKASPHMIRVNAWPGFFENELLETAGEMNATAAGILKSLNKKFISVPDEPGLVSARVIAMIINEAYYAKGEEVSTEEDIDIAMKLGTNYPYGPFEWCRKIGADKVFALLSKLSKADTKYSPAPALANEINKEA